MAEDAANQSVYSILTDRFSRNQQNDGSEDKFGFYAAKDKVHVHDFHATVLHLVGIDHERLTYRYGGRDFRLTDVEGNVVKDVFA